MTEYRRAFQQGGCYFFSVVTHQRRPILTRPEILARLREAFIRVNAKMPFTMDAVAILPDHLHCIWQLPENDVDFSGRWQRIKHFVSAGIAAETNIESRKLKREKAVWQRRFWEHLIRDEDDWKRHMDYIHYNPVKHGYVLSPADWPHSSFLKSVKRGWYDLNWGASEPAAIQGLSFE